MTNRTSPSKVEQERSMALAEATRSSLNRLGLPHTPRNYEIWYAHASGHNRALNTALEAMLAAGGTPTESDLDILHETHFGGARTLGKLQNVGSGISAELRGIVGVVTGTLGATSIYGNTLHQASRDLTGAGDPGSIRSIVQALAAATLEMRAGGLQLKARLDGAMSEIASLQQGLQAIRMESRTDPLTELANRKHFDETIDEAVCASGQRGEPLSLLMIDIDHFKSVNDTFGHTTGDQVLRLVAMSLKQNIKGQDLAARYGGEEFAIVLPNTALRQGIAVADHVRRAVMAKEVKKRSTGEIIGRMTISVGVASLLQGDTRESLIERADQCLYSAKRGGRNRVVGMVDTRILPDTAACVA
ncbi:MAG: GGDEF domain-containing protein [Bradyrhizobium sp.]